MARLIDADDFVEYFEKAKERIKILPRELREALNGLYEDFIETIKERPTVDAVEVVRCKDCKQWCEDTLSCMLGNHYDDNWYGEDFCSYGERRADG